MRFARLSLILAALVALSANGAFADKVEETNDKSAQYSFGAGPGFGLAAVLPESEPANDVCPGQPMACGDVISPATVAAGNLDWYTFTLAAGDILVFETAPNAAAGPAVDTFVEVWDAACAVMLASDDDDGVGLYSLVELCAPAAGTYNVKVRGFAAASAGGYSARLLCSAGGADVCANAPILRCGMLDLAGGTNCAVNNYTTAAAGVCTGFTAAGRDVVYRIDAQVGWNLSATYTSSGDGSIYLVTDCAAIEASCVAGADDTLSGFPEVLSYAFTAAGTYYLILDSFGTNTFGTYSLTGVLDCPVGVEATSWDNVKQLYR